MELSTNQKTLISEECQKRMLEGQCLHSVGLGHVVRACPNKGPYSCQLHENEIHIALLKFNVSMAQTAPVVVNTEGVYVAPPPFSKSVES
jgi:hypothetical protein